MKELKFLLGTDLSVAAKELHNNPDSFTEFNDKILTSDMTTDEMYEAVVGMNESDYKKYVEQWEREYEEKHKLNK